MLAVVMYSTSQHDHVSLERLFSAFVSNVLHRATNSFDHLAICISKYAWTVYSVIHILISHLPVYEVKQNRDFAEAIVEKLQRIPGGILEERP